jgi:3-dehydroquinate dehydratase II
MPKEIIVLNGPNLNLLGKRQPEIYGSRTLADIEAECAVLARELGLKATWRQSNSEGELIGWIHDARTGAAGIVINAGALSHTSIAIYDALTCFEGPVIEVHISNIFKREEWRHHSWVSQRADGVIAGCGTDGYGLALRRIAGVLG